jgi:hypothetical protein
MRRRTIVGRRRNLAPVDFEQVSLIHCSSLGIQYAWT